MLVSGLLSSRGAPAGILNLVINGSLILVLDTRIFDEYADVLRRKKFAFPEDAIREILTFIKREGVFVPPPPVAFTGPPAIFRLSKWHSTPGSAVTGNVRHFQGSGVMVMTPAEFLERYPAGRPGPRS